VGVVGVLAVVALGVLLGCNDPATVRLVLVMIGIERGDETESKGREGV